jgi:YegS/Rv2252/BmrU family lipid kinase
MKLRFIINPRSGIRRRNAGNLARVREFVARRGLDAEVVSTEGRGHATQIAREAVAAGCSRIIAVGGDGTVNEVAQALIHSPAALGLVPCGSGNGLALHLGLPRSMPEALELAAGTEARIAELDTGSVNGLLFVNAMGLGLDADVSFRFNRLLRRGLLAYAGTALAAFVHRHSERCTVADGARRETVDALLIAVANSDQYGNNARIAPHARVDDGMLDLVVVLPTGFAGALALGARLFLGTIDRSAHVRRLKAARFVIERPSEGIIHTDGETHLAGTSVEVHVQPRSLKFIVPDGCAAVAPAREHPGAGFALQLP